MMNNETDIHLPSINSNNSNNIKQQLSLSKITKSNSQLTNTTIKYCNTTPNIKTDKKKTVIILNNNHKDEATLKKELYEFLEKHNLPNPDNLIEEMDKVLIDRLKLESKLIEKKLIKALGVYYEKDNIANNAERNQKTSEEKVNELIQQRKILKKKNIQLKECVSGLTRALSNVNNEVFRLKGVIENDKQMVIDLNKKLDMKIIEEQKKQNTLKTELTYLTIKLENMDDTENEVKKKQCRPLHEIVEKKPLLTEPDKSSHERNKKKFTVKELSNIVIELRKEIDELKKTSLALKLEKQTLHQKIKLQEKDIDIQQKNMDSLSSILKEKDKLAHWNKICQINHKNATLRQSSNNINPLIQSINPTNLSLHSP